MVLLDVFRAVPTQAPGGLRRAVTHDARRRYQQKRPMRLRFMGDEDRLNVPPVEGGLLDAMTPHIEAVERREQRVEEDLAPTPLVFRVLLTLALIGGLAWAWSLEAFGPLGVLVVLFVLVVPFEKLFPRHAQPLRRPMVVSDMTHALLLPVNGVLASIVVVVVAVLSLMWIPGLLLRPLVDQLPELPRLVLGVLLFDFAVYWTHRFHHEVPFLWRFHQVHHSTEHLDWVSGFRVHPLDGALLAPAFVFLTAAGFSPEFSGVLAVAQAITGLFLHANVRFRWRLLHRLIITPEFHHWHHSNHEEARWSNYSTFLPLWDMIFRTYHMPKDARPQTYGIDTPMPKGVMEQWLLPFRGLGSPVNAVRHPWRSLKLVLSGTKRLLRDMRWSLMRKRDQTPFGVPKIPIPQDT